jgi:hypothetical protein
MSADTARSTARMAPAICAGVSAEIAVIWEILTGSSQRMNSPLTKKNALNLAN